MKVLTLILISIIYTSTTFAATKAPKKNKAMCKLFTEKAKQYKKHMRNDEYAIVTLHSYEKRAKLYCPDK